MAALVPHPRPTAPMILPGTSVAARAYMMNALTADLMPGRRPKIRVPSRAAAFPAT